jgi:CubicO group peptidase (beta-lactamase class C family)
MPSAFAQEALPLTPTLTATLDASLATFATAPNAATPSLSVALVEHDRIAYAQAFGQSDLARHTPATPQTRYHIASITKMFTAVAVMQLVEQGRIALDAPVATYLPSAPHAREITIRQLLQHTSGLWNYADQAVADGSVRTATTPQSILTSLAARPLENAPGAKFHYSNTGYVVLGLVVEAVGGMPLADYERAHIFAPAGLTETGFIEDGTTARGYMNSDGTPAAEYSPTWFYGAGDIVSTAGDVARFDIALLDGKLVQPQTLALMRSSNVDASELAPGARYGLGLMEITRGSLAAFGHHGGVPGFAADNEILPDRHLAIVTLTDAFTFGTGFVNQSVVLALLPGALPVPAPETAQLTEDPVVTERLRTLLTTIAAGTLDATTLTSTMRTALKPNVLAQITNYYAALGALQSLKLHSRRTVGVYAVYEYGATFAGGKKLDITASFDPDGKVAGLIQ